MGEIAGNWEASKIKHDSERRAYYFLQNSSWAE